MQKLMVFILVVFVGMQAHAFGGGGGRMFDKEWMRGVDAFALHFNGKGQADIKFGECQNGTMNTYGVCVSCNAGYKLENGKCVKDACANFSVTECIKTCTSSNGVATYTYGTTCANGGSCQGGTCVTNCNLGNSLSATQDWVDHDKCECKKGSHEYAAGTYGTWCVEDCNAEFLDQCPLHGVCPLTCGDAFGTHYMFSDCEDGWKKNAAGTACEDATTECSKNHLINCDESQCEAMGGYWMTHYTDCTITASGDMNCPTDHNYCVAQSNTCKDSSYIYNAQYQMCYTQPQCPTGSVCEKRTYRQSNQTTYVRRLYCSQDCSACDTGFTWDNSIKACKIVLSDNDYELMRSCIQQSYKTWDNGDCVCVSGYTLNSNNECEPTTETNLCANVTCDPCNSCDATDGKCKPDNTQTCASGTCQNGACVPSVPPITTRTCTTNADCGTGEFCNHPGPQACFSEEILSFAQRFTNDFSGRCQTIGSPITFGKYSTINRGMSYQAAQNWCQAQSKNLLVSPITDGYILNGYNGGYFTPCGTASTMKTTDYLSSRWQEEAGDQNFTWNTLSYEKVKAWEQFMNSAACHDSNPPTPFFYPSSQCHTLFNLIPSDLHYDDDLPDMRGVFWANYDSYLKNMCNKTNITLGYWDDTQYEACGIGVNMNYDANIPVSLYDNQEAWNAYEQEFGHDDDDDDDDDDDNNNRLVPTSLNELVTHFAPWPLCE